MEHGSAVNLMKSSSKRKRTRSELEEVKEEEDALKQDRHSFLQQVKRLKEEKAQLEGMLNFDQAPLNLVQESENPRSSRSSQQVFEI